MSRQDTKLGKKRLGVALATFGADARPADAPGFIIQQLAALLLALPLLRRHGTAE